jgi:hypothetical protein
MEEHKLQVYDVKVKALDMEISSRFNVEIEINSSKNIKLFYLQPVFLPSSQEMMYYISKCAAL